MKNTIHAQPAGYWSDIVSAVGLQVNPPLPSSTLLNQAAPTSLYQASSQLKMQLLSLRGFQHYIDLVAAHEWKGLSQPIDPVTQLWDVFSYGVPLCYIYNKLPQDQGYGKIPHSEFDPQKLNERERKHAIALFVMQLQSDAITRTIPDCELFTVVELWDRWSSDGIVKVRIMLC